MQVKKKIDQQKIIFAFAVFQWKLSASKQINQKIIFLSKHSQPVSEIIWLLNFIVINQRDTIGIKSASEEKTVRRRKLIYGEQIAAENECEEWNYGEWNDKKNKSRSFRETAKIWSTVV